jgi:hypothetical protein
MGALKVQLDPDDLERVRELVNEVDSAGGLAEARYPAYYMEMVFRETPALE